jgi:ABC-type multidrug transport system fused ATPase/permease subunit
VSSQQRKIFWDLSIFTPGTQMLSQLSLVILFAYGGWLYVQGKIPLGGGLVVFAGLLQQFTGQVANISTIANSVQQSLAAARRVYEVLDTPLDVQNRANAVKPGRLTGEIIFENVSFGYSSRTHNQRSADSLVREFHLQRRQFADKAVRAPRTAKTRAHGHILFHQTRPGGWHLRHDRCRQKQPAGFDPAFL